MQTNPRRAQSNVPLMPPPAKKGPVSAGAVRPVAATYTVRAPVARTMPDDGPSRAMCASRRGCVLIATIGVCLLAGSGLLAYGIYELVT